MEVPIGDGSPAKRELVILTKSDQITSQTNTTIANTFHQFPNLPKELRLKIWEQVMIEARPSRRIIIDEGRVVPFKQLISPLLIVNYESRTCAQAFYNVKLDIYAVPPVTQDQVKHLDKQKNWNRIEGSERAVDGKVHGYNDEWVENEFEEQRQAVQSSFGSHYDPEERDYDIDKINRDEKEYTVDLEDHWSDFVRDELRVLGANSIRKAEASGPTTGAFYISPEHDVFITDYDCTAHFSIDSASGILGEDFPSIQDISCRHISEKLPAAICQRVSTLVLVRLSHFWHIRDAEEFHYEERHCVFADNKAVRAGGWKNGFDREFQSGWRQKQWETWCLKSRTTWKKKTFPSVQAHFVLWHFDYGHEKGAFLTKLTKMNDVEISEGLQLWEKGEFNRNGKVIPGLKKKKCRFGTEKADWARDLMAHWDISN
ncbi:hypothetical protein INS49_005661 [Diaporthe citri]|uniref:uncharacterized protein n=1 Tax=Diaporthe citri TaxID=83186 RepID=UPI001C809A69|nr:uncharacterized protein INS49_005661 [Diaporthe citri]KAG6353480.1 hypothetical protein INS49_005661 [Diaporthe citri]